MSEAAHTQPDDRGAARVAGRTPGAPPRRGWHRAVVAVVVVVAPALVLAGCSQSENTARSSTQDQFSTATNPPEAKGGWDCPGGTCSWDTGRGGAAGVDAATSAGGGALDEAVAAKAPPGGVAPPTTAAAKPGAVSPDAPVTAGSIDDNEAWDEYLRYRARAESAGFPFEKIPVEGRQVITVHDAGGRPVLGADVDVRDSGGTQVAHLLTHADGRAFFYPTALPDPKTQNLPGYTATITKGTARATATLDASTPSATVRLDRAMAPAPTQLDVLFLLDATGSMGDEIARLKANISAVAQRIDALPSHPDVHFALTVYRDRGDAFVTRTFDFTSDETQFARALNEVRADGGGDTPEDLDAGLADAVSKAVWRGPDAVKLVFLVADAPPHLDYPESTTYGASLRNAATRGIKVLPIGASGLDAQGAYIFRQLAQYTGGRFVFLTYGADGASPGTSTPHASPDQYSVLPLDELIVALVTAELSPRS